MSHVEINSINKKIQQTEDELTNADLIANRDMRNMLTSELRRRLDSLYTARSELERSLSKETVSLRIYGDNVQFGRVSNRVLLSALSGFQLMADSIADAVHRAPTSRGKIPDTVKEITDFKVIGTFAGSFGITLEKSNDQLGIVTEINKVLDELFNVLESVDNSDQLLCAITPYGKRTVAHYRQWIDELKENDVNLEISWRDESANNRKMNLLKEKAYGIISTLDTIDKIDNESVVLQGILTGINLRNHSFEITIEGAGIIKGTALPETLILISDKLGKEVVTNLIRSTSYTKANVQKISWYLESIKN